MPPTRPTLSIPALSFGSPITATVTGFDVGTTNDIFVKNANDIGWPVTPEATADGAGLAPLTLTPGSYFASVESSLSGESVIGLTDPVFFEVRSASAKFADYRVLRTEKILGTNKQKVFLERLKKPIVPNEPA